MKECRKCGHDCHCGKDCEKCINEVCYECACDEEIIDV